MFIGRPPNVAQRPYALVEQMVDIGMNRSEVMLGSGGTFLSGMRWYINCDEICPDGDWWGR